ncbi:hypothetical protein ACT3R3_14590 [Glutamicibacter sp. AOP5-B1-3]|uniref:hypothetical protein n=1 Tax=Glutamicibacter ardleyensis TaxID=225894 RepID=UPI003FD571FE
MAQAAQCGLVDFGCKIGDGLKNLADSAITDFVKSLYDGAVAFVAQVSTFWMDTPSPDVDNAAVISLRDDMSWYVAGFAVLGFLIGLIKLVMSQDVKNSLIGLGTPIVNLILATTAYATGISLLLTASDEFSKWIVERSTDGNVDLTQMLSTGSALLASPGTAFLLFILLLLGAVINLLFMYFRDVMFLILSAFIVALAAASGSEQGRQAWRKANGWLIALLLFKPVAAGIYSLGFRMLVEGRAEGEEVSVAEAMHSTLIALLILLLAALALPALVKFIVPAAGVGAGAFSGGAALGAGVTLAAGAAVVAGTGGAAAAAGGAGAAMGGGAGASGAAAAGGGSTAAGAAGGGSEASSGAAGSAASGGAAGGESAAAGTTGGGASGGGSAGGGGSSASETISGTDGGSSASGAASGEGSPGSASSSGSSASGSGNSTSDTGSSSSPAAGSGSTASSGASNSSAGNPGSSSSGSSASGSTGSSASGANSTGSPQTSTPSSGPSGAKPTNKANEAMQKMGDVKGLANGANPSKLVDEDGE